VLVASEGVRELARLSWPPGEDKGMAYKIWFEQIDGEPDVEYIDEALEGTGWNQIGSIDMDAVRQEGLRNWRYDSVPVLFNVGVYQFCKDLAPDGTGIKGNGLYVLAGAVDELEDLLMIARTLVGTCGTWLELMKQSAIALGN
jgi:hypothetical protein